MENVEPLNVIGSDPKLETIRKSSVSGSRLLLLRSVVNFGSLEGGILILGAINIDILEYNKSIMPDCEGQWTVENNGQWSQFSRTWLDKLIGDYCLV